MEVTFAYGSYTAENSTGLASSSYPLFLSSILYVTTFPFNLLSPSNLIKLTLCHVDPNYVTLQDLKLQYVTGTRHDLHGLYYFGEPRFVVHTVVETPMNVHFGMMDGPNLNN